MHKLYNAFNNDPVVDCSVGGDADCMNASVVGCCGFACHRDWRLPEVGRDGGTEELETLIEPCSFPAPCIDPIFDPTAAERYWSAIEGVDDDGINFAWFVDFLFGNLGAGLRNDFHHVRAVRTAP